MSVFCIFTYFPSVINCIRQSLAFLRPKASHTCWRLAFTHHPSHLISLSWVQSWLSIFEHQQFISRNLSYLDSRSIIVDLYLDWIFVVLSYKTRSLLSLDLRWLIVNLSLNYWVFVVLSYTIYYLYKNKFIIFEFVLINNQSLFRSSFCCIIVH